MYDSTDETRKHIETVQSLLRQIAGNIGLRVVVHDASKLQEPEKSMYDEFTPRLRGMTYGSDEYKACLKEMGPALQHHYAVNGHHPEHWPEPTALEIGELRLLIHDTDPSDPALPWLEAHLAELESRLNGMSLLDVIEMLADWNAAGMRHADGNMAQSLEINRKRFKISDQLYQILKNTIAELDW